MEEQYNGHAETLHAWLQGLTPDPLLTVSEWADQHRMLSPSASSEPGRWRTSRTPYLREIMDELSPASPTERVVFMKGAQIGGTEAGANWVGYVIHHAPGPMMIVWPTTETAKRNSKHRIDALIEGSDALRERVAQARSRDASNTILVKEFRGGVLVITGANSAVGLRSTPVRYLMLDEVDAFPPDVDGEGDPIKLAEARTRTFARRKMFLVSTPTITGFSAIEREYLASDQRRFFLPCPHCAHRQWLRFEQLRWTRGEPETAAYHCEACEQKIAEHHKTWMLDNGEWRKTGKGKTAGFHLSSLYSPLGWRSWVQIAEAWEEAIDRERGSQAAIKTFKNVELGETFAETGDAPDWERLAERREDYRIGSIPYGGLLLTAGVDVQKDRIEASIWAFGRQRERWLIEHRVIMGSVYQRETWDSLTALLAESWPHESGVSVPLKKLAIDTGFETATVYDWVRTARDSRVMPVKGQAKGIALIGTPTAVEVAGTGKKLRRGLKVFNVAVGIGKTELYNDLRKTAELADDGLTMRFPAGYVHLPKVDAEYLQQLCAEHLIPVRDRRGYVKREWQKIRDRNEALDCCIYARAAAAAAGVDRMGEQHWRALELQLGLIEAEPAVEEEREDDFSVAAATLAVAVQPRSRAPRRVVKSSWMGR